MIMTVGFLTAYSHTDICADSSSHCLHEDSSLFPMVYTNIACHTSKIWWPKHDVVHVTNGIGQYDSGKFYLLTDATGFVDDVYQVRYDQVNHCIVIDSLLESTRHLDESSSNQKRVVPLKQKGDTVFLSNDSQEIYINGEYYWSDMAFRQHAKCCDPARTRSELPWLTPRNNSGLIAEMPNILNSLLSQSPKTLQIASTNQNSKRPELLSPPMSEQFLEKEQFKKLYGFVPHRYTFSDRPDRRVTLEFISPDTILLTNDADNSLQSFEDCYFAEKICDGEQTKYRLSKRVHTTRRDSTHKAACHLRPFSRDCATGSDQILSDCSGDTLTFVADESIAFLGNLCFKTEGAGHYGSWFASGKKLELSPFFTPDKIDELERFLASSTQRIGDQDFEVDLSKLKLFWSFRKEE